MKKILTLLFGMLLISSSSYAVTINFYLTNTTGVRIGVSCGGPLRSSEEYYSNAGDSNVKFTTFEDQGVFDASLDGNKGYHCQATYIGSKCPGICQSSKRNFYICAKGKKAKVSVYITAYPVGKDSKGNFKTLSITRPIINGQNC